MSAKHYRWDDIPKERVNNWMERRIITGERAMVAQIFLKEGCPVPEHRHESEQISYIIRGALKFVVEGEEIVVRAGELLHVRSNVPHSAVALEETFSMDIFAPPREDWLAGTDAYLRTARPESEDWGSKKTSG